MDHLNILMDYIDPSLLATDSITEILYDRNMDNLIDGYLEDVEIINSWQDLKTSYRPRTIAGAISCLIGLGVKLGIKPVSQSNVSQFYCAAKAGNLEAIVEFLSYEKCFSRHKFDINEIGHKVAGSMALHVAAYYKHHGIVKYLLEHGASTTIVNKYNELPLDNYVSPE